MRNGEMGNEYIFNRFPIFFYIYRFPIFFYICFLLSPSLQEWCLK